MPEGLKFDAPPTKLPKFWKASKSDIHFGLDRLKGRERDFQGAEVREIETRGKALFTHSKTNSRSIRTISYMDAGMS